MTNPNIFGFTAAERSAFTRKKLIEPIALWEKIVAGLVVVLMLVVAISMYVFDHTEKAHAEMKEEVLAPQIVNIEEAKIAMADYCGDFKGYKERKKSLREEPNKKLIAVCRKYGLW